MDDRLIKTGAIAILVCLAAQCGRCGAWPVLRTYEGEHLRKVKMPLGGIGTGTISLSGRGGLVDWEIRNHPDKGFTPATCGPNQTVFCPNFAIRCAWGTNRVARLLEGPLRPDEYEGVQGSVAPNHGFPRFSSAVFKAAYPLAQVELRDGDVPVAATLEAMNPLVPGDPEASGIPAVLLRWRVTNLIRERVDVSICGTIVNNLYGEFPNDGELCIRLGHDSGAVTRATSVRHPGWSAGLRAFWERFLARGDVADTPADAPEYWHRIPMEQLATTVPLASGETRTVTFAIAWRAPSRTGWTNGKLPLKERCVGNHYAQTYPTARAAADDLLARLPELEAKTVAFVESVLSSPAPDVVKEAALFNLSTFRTETCFRTADGHFFGWEGCGNGRGSCYGSCTHVWGYEHALVDLWPSLARDALDLQFGPALHPDGGMSFRIGLPLATDADRNKGVAADGQMQCVVKACEYVRKTGDAEWLKRTWPAIRRAVEFAWIPGGWDADKDGVMEGCQHNTMDVEYYGPNPEMEFLYLAALRAASRMAVEAGDAAFAETCRELEARGSAWTEQNLFNGSYYEHKIRPPVGAIAEGLRLHMGASDIMNPDFQLGAGCLADQLLGDYAAQSAGIGAVADRAHAAKALASILANNRTSGGDEFNPMRSFAFPGERAIRVAWYPPGKMERVPFPYFCETWTGLEYVVAALLAWRGEFAESESVVRDVRARFDGAKRNPFNEPECGYHYVRALASWTVLKAFREAASGTTGGEAPVRKSDRTAIPAGKGRT